MLVWSVVLLGGQRGEHVERREPGGEGEERGEQRHGQRQQQRGLLEHGAHQAHRGGRAQHRRRHRQPRHDQPGQQQPLLLLQCTTNVIYLINIFTTFYLLHYLDHPDEEAHGDRQHKHLDYEGGEGVEGELVTTADIAHYYLEYLD